LTTLSSQAKYAERRKWSRLLQAVRLAADRVEASGASGEAPDGEQADGAVPDAKRQRMMPPGLRDSWRELRGSADGIERQLQRMDGHATAPVFAFVEGALVVALREGSWLLLDELNLAPPETLERLACVLEVRPPAGSATPAYCGCPSISRRGCPCHSRAESAHIALFWSPLTAPQCPCAEVALLYPTYLL